MVLRPGIDHTRAAIIRQPGHVLVTGGPGSGKTTVALLKALHRSESLLPEQSILFLSFSRAAVHQVRDRMRELLESTVRKRVEVSTYHLFCLRVLEAHGRLLNGCIPRIITPVEERLLKAEHGDDWPGERARLAQQEGRYCFDLFASSVADLLERSSAIRTLYCSRYPLIILDEFQDTDDDQWRLVQALSRGSEIVCLADPDQRIFEYRGNIDPARLDQLREKLSPVCFDLGQQNHRSPQAGILEFGNAILKNKPLPKSSSVRQVTAPPSSSAWASTVHAAVVWMFRELRRVGIDDPSVAVLARTNAIVERISILLRDEHVYRGRALHPVPHDVVWDAELTAAAGQVIASILEWSGRSPRAGVAQTLEAIADYYRLKHAEKATKISASRATDFAAAATEVRAGRRVRRKAPRMLVEAAAHGTHLQGVPVEDWRAARAILSSVPDLSEIAETSRMLRLFRAGDILAAGLQDIWVRRGNYTGARNWLRRTLDRQRLLDVERPSRGCVLMNMHKSKGKEFDGVVIVEAPYFPLIASRGGRALQDRRLLRVAITRARHQVILVRPQGADALTKA